MTITVLGWLVHQAITQESLLSLAGGALTVLWVWGLQMEWEVWACSCPTVSELFHPLPLLLESALGETLSQGRSSEVDATMKGQFEMLDLPIFNLEPVCDFGSTCTWFVLP